ncbi:hypothetical protein HBI79_114280 [Parastagonospora nodorum]|nr:hypothetical protein HBI79_114280 [Parastagonospora nodorum]
MFSCYLYNNRRYLFTLNAAQETAIDSLLVVVIVPKQACTLALENARNPTVLVGDSPDSHTDTLLDSETSLCTVVPDCNLGSSGRLGGAVVVLPDIELSVSNLDTKIGSGSESSGESR